MGKSTVRRAAALILATLVLGTAVLVAANNREAARRDRPLDSPVLTATDQQALLLAIDLHARTGDQVWPGFGSASLPFIIYNDQYEFVVRTAAPPPPWQPVAGATFQGAPYYRRPAADPQAFAVPLGHGWAGSLPALDRMNREYLLGVREMLPPALAPLFPYQWATVAPDLYAAVALHELFHAYQATQAPRRIREWRAAYQAKGQYPYANPDFIAAWNAEGRLLWQAMQATEPAERVERVRQFLDARARRRAAANLDAAALTFEREVEWIEGLARYAEVRGYDLAAGDDEGPFRRAGFRPGQPHWQQDFKRLERSLGEQDEDHRFYLSGMAMGFILDQLRPDWKAAALAEGVYLEDLLQAAVAGQ